MDALSRDLAALVECAGEDAALRRLHGMARRLGLDAELAEEDLAALRRADGYPGEEVERTALRTLTITLPGQRPGAPRLVFNGHLDVVPPGAAPWSSPPHRPVVRGGRMYGRGTADMKAGVVAALHAMASVRATGRPPGDVVLHAVAGEEDGGIGAFAALRRDADFAGCLIPEPTGGALVCATAGALTFRLRVAGRAAHASYRLDGVSAIDRYWPVHEALGAFERRLNSRVEHPLMRELELPYPVSVGRLVSGEWASTVPDELICEGRLGVPVGGDVDALREEFAAAMREVGAEVTWSGGQFAPAQTSPEHPFVDTVQRQITAVTGGPAPVTGVPYGTDLRQYAARGIPAVLYGPGSVDQAHAADEHVLLADVARCARVLAQVARVFGTVANG